MAIDQVGPRAVTHRDPYVFRYAQRARGLVPSQIRALFSVASRPEVVSLAGGMPYLEGLPLEVLGDLLRRLVTEEGTAALQYGTAQGDPELRAGISDVMRLEGIDGRPDDVLVTAGSQQALDLVTRVFVDPGDVVFAEAPSYVGALATFATYQADVVQVPMDAEGLIPEALQEAVTRVRTAGRTAKLLYTVPNFHNPAGVTLSAERRAKILALCHRAGLCVVEDNPYGLLRYSGEPIPAMRASDPDVVYLGSFSKTLAPGFRVGWVLARPGLRDKLVLAAESASLCNSRLAQLAVARYLTTEPWQDHVKKLCEVYAERREAMLGALAAGMPGGCRWTSPQGGFFVWLTLPEGLDSAVLAAPAIAAGVAYVPGTGFYADGRGHRHLRLSYSFPTPGRIHEGIRRLATVMGGELAGAA